MTFHGIYSFPRDSFIVNISMHFWPTLDMTCSGSQGDLVSLFAGARDAPSMKSISMKSISYHGDFSYRNGPKERRVPKERLARKSAGGYPTISIISAGSRMSA